MDNGHAKIARETIEVAHELGAIHRKTVSIFHFSVIEFRQNHCRIYVSSLAFCDLHTYSVRLIDSSKLKMTELPFHRGGSIKT